MKKYLLALLSVCGPPVLAGCGGGSSTPPPPVATHLSVTAASSTITAGTALSITVSALDPAAALVSSYTGSVHFTSTDSQAVLPADTPLTGGTVTIQVTLKSAGTQTVTAGDVANKLTAGTTGSIAVSTGTAALAITSGNPPDGVAGSFYGPLECGLPGTGPCYYGFLLTATGGVQPYGWSWAPQSGSLTPPGLSLVSHGACPQNAKFSGGWKIICTPTTPGTYNVIVTVTDSASPPNQVSANYTIKIAGPIITTNPPPPQGTINLPYSFRLTAINANYAPMNWSETGALPAGLNLATDGTLSGTPTTMGSFPITVMLTDSRGNSAVPQDFTIVIGEHGFKAAGIMVAAREFHTATLLHNGLVLIAGGTSDSELVSATAELYDNTTGTFSTASNMTAGRTWFTATLLKDGKILIAGGFDGNRTALDSAEIFDPASGTFTPTGNMLSPRLRHTATLLSNGKVLIAGGTDGNTDLPSAELFDPTNGSFSSTGPMATGRQEHTATILQNGKVLVTGGLRSTGLASEDAEASAELFDPVAGTFSSAGTMSTPRYNHTATLLNSGKVLVAGGLFSTICQPSACGAADDLASAELFDPASAAFAPAGSMAIPRNLHTATLLKNGAVLVAGGNNGNTISLASAEIFNPNTGSFSNTGSLLTPREGHAATLLNDGTVLITGGLSSAVGFLASAETYQ